MKRLKLTPREELPKHKGQFTGDEVIACPVCGNPVYVEDICRVCSWQNTGIVNIDGGPNPLDLEDAIEAYKQGKPLR